MATAANTTESGQSAPTTSRSPSVYVDGRTVPEAFLRRVELSRGTPAYRFKKDGRFHEVTWGELQQKVLTVYGALRKMGLKPGARVAVMSQTRPEFLMIDQANMAGGFVTVPIYYSNSVEDIAYILEHCGAEVVFVEDDVALLKVSQAFAQNAKKIPVITLYEPARSPEGLSITPFTKLVAGEKLEILEAEAKKNAAKLDPSELATIVYTSGTTGKPKGAVLLHLNLVSELRALITEMALTAHDSTLTFLPMAHIMGRIESMIGIFSGTVLNFAESINSVAQDIQEISPTLLVSVPRIYEKIFAKIQSEVQAGSPVKRSIFFWAVGIGKEYARHLSEKKPVPLPLALKYRVADQLVFSKVRGKLGGRIRVTVSGGAPLSRDLCEFFHACGIPIMEAYGLTETTAAITANRPNDYRFGTVGRPLTGVEIRIANDGEILAKGPVVFREYFKNGDGTKEVFVDGWFATGDIGEIDDRGFLRITDRKKELIVTSGGKNIAPQKLENLLKGSRLISNAMVYGDREKFLVALIAMNEGEMKKWAKEKGVSDNVAELATNPEVEKLIDAEVRQVNKELASYESIKKFTLVPADFTVETGELTPSLKLKRKVIIAKYKPLIDKMYRGSAD